MSDNSNNQLFRLQIEEFVRLAGERAAQVTRMLALQGATNVVQRSPVDTGRFRANWQYGANAVNTDTSDDTDASGSDTVGRLGGELNSWSPGDTIYLTNSLPYARRLEYGWSQQAPAGMVRVTVVEMNSYLAAAVAAARSGAAA